MRNVIISIILFFSLFGLVFFANNHLIEFCGNIVNSCEKIEDLIESDKYDEAYNASVDLLFYMQEQAFISTIYINHTEVDSLVNQTVALTVQIKCRSESDALSTLHIIKYTSTMIKCLQSPNIRNIL